MEANELKSASSNAGVTSASLSAVAELSSPLTNKRKLDSQPSNKSSKTYRKRREKAVVTTKTVKDDATAMVLQTLSNYSPEALAIYQEFDYAYSSYDFIALHDFCMKRCKSNLVMAVVTLQPNELRPVNRYKEINGAESVASYFYASQLGIPDAFYTQKIQHVYYPVAASSTLPKRKTNLTTESTAAEESQFFLTIVASLFIKGTKVHEIDVTEDAAEHARNSLLEEAIVGLQELRESDFLANEVTTSSSIVASASSDDEEDHTKRLEINETTTDYMKKSNLIIENTNVLKDQFRDDQDVSKILTFDTVISRSASGELLHQDTTVKVSSSMLMKDRAIDRKKVFIG